VIRVAAVGDVHLGEDLRGSLRPRLADLGQHADVLLLAGDLTRYGDPGEMRVVAGEFAGLEVPVVAVLGNHDYQCDRSDEVTAILQDAGIHMLEGTGEVLEVAGGRVGIAGTKGFGG
jgi:Icc-related predicted phosphoesterase